MRNSQKIDALFNGEEQFKSFPPDIKPQSSKLSRFVKLGFPCIAATLLGIMIIIPNIKKTVDLQDNITMPRKHELEKLHIEETVFNTVDDKNRVNKVTADSVDEVNPGSSKVRFNNPRAEIPFDDGQAIITSEYGYFTQDTTVLDLNENVVAVINDDTTIKTEHVVYDFKHEFGYGKNDLIASGSWGTMFAPEFTYDKKNYLLTLVGKNEIKTDKGSLMSDKETLIYHQENKIITKGKAKLQQNNNTVQADEIVAFFNGNSHKELQRLEAYGNVSVTTPKGKATGDRGLYDPVSKKVELFDNVRIEQNGNFIEGSHAVTDLETSVSRIKGDKSSGGRISGIFYNKRKSKDGGNAS